MMTGRDLGSGKAHNRAEKFALLPEVRGLCFVCIITACRNNTSQTIVQYRHQDSNSSGCSLWIRFLRHDRSEMRRLYTAF